MNISAILVIVAKDDVQLMCERIAALPGIEVHHIEASTGRLIVTQEASTIDQEVDGLKSLQALPGVQLAEMVEHHFESDPSSEEPRPEEIPSLLTN